MKTHRNPSSLRFKRGFTLVELVIVLTIIGILSGSGIYMLIGFLDEAKYERV